MSILATDSPLTESLIPVLVGAGISAFVSFIIFALTQVFLFYKARSDILRTKLEELWKVLIDILRKTRPVTTAETELNEAVRKNLHERATLLIESLMIPTPYIALYFSELNGRFVKINHACGNLVQVMRSMPSERKGSSSDDYLNSLQLKKFVNELNVASSDVKKNIEELLSYLRENKETLIKTPRFYLTSIWSRRAR